MNLNTCKSCELKHKIPYNVETRFEMKFLVSHFCIFEVSTEIYWWQKVDILFILNKGKKEMENFSPQHPGLFFQRRSVRKLF